MGCYIWYSEKGTGRDEAPSSPLLAVPNVTLHPLTASVPITVLLYDDPLFCGFNVAIKGLIAIYVISRLFHIVVIRVAEECDCVVDRNNTPPPAAAATKAAMQRSRPLRLNDGLSRVNNNNPPELTIEVQHVSDEPVPSSCGCMTDLSHHQFHYHHHPPTPHYHGNIDVTASSPTDEISDVTPANDLLNLGSFYRLSTTFETWSLTSETQPKFYYSVSMPIADSALYR